MQQRQQSLFSFFQNGARTSNTQQQELPGHGEEEVPQVPMMSQRKENFPRNFEALKSRLLRPQQAPSSEKNYHSVSRQGPWNGVSFLNVSPDSVAAKETTEKSMDAAEKLRDGDERMYFFGPSHALDSSIPGIKRVWEDHDSCLSDESRLLKRKKLMEALGEGEEQRGLWEEAKSKFEWLISSKVRDSKGRKPGDPFYDKRTVQIPLDALNKMSGSQKQYWATKCQYMDTVIFFKVGKFYELYELDAEVGHKELNWKMTVGGVGKCRQVGVPESGIEDAVEKLLACGYKVGRMEQVETADQAKAKRGPGAIIQRKLTQVSTPSTAMDENMKPEAVHLLALREERAFSTNSCNVDSSAEKTTFGFAFVDAAAGRFYVGSLRDDSARSALGALLTQVVPRELLYELGGLSDETMKALRRYSSQGFVPLELTSLQPNLEFMEASAAINMIESHGFFSESIDNDSSHSSRMSKWLQVLKTVNDFKSAATALGALALHLIRLKLDEALLEKGLLASYDVYKGSLRLDGQTLSNLEIFHNNADGGKTGTLFSFLDNCSTPFGKRLLRRWMCHPLQRVGEINERLDAVEEFRRHPDLVGVLRAGLRKLPDLERLVSRIRTFSCSSDAATISLLSNRVQRQKVQAFSAVVKGLVCGCAILRSIREGGHEGTINSCLLLSVSDLEGVNEAYKSLVSMASHVDKKFSIPKNQLLKKDHVLDDKDTQLLNHLLLEFNQHNGCWLLVIENLSQIDVLLSFTMSIDGANGPTCRPTFVSSSGSPKGGAVLKVQELWHPFATGSQCGVFVRNNVELGSNTSSCRAMLLTGPNMGGKSTLLRASCIVVILAQMGCYVPAESCILSPVDIIFTRLGASDRIMSGESTFMVECMEASSVLRYASPNSLVILDELGQGTSTFDGYAIAYAVFRHLVDTIDCRLLFATHYHPLTKEFAAYPSVSLQHMACAFQDSRGTKGLDREALSSGEPSKSSAYEKRLVFLYKLSPGASPDSYGLHVASLAGLPKTVIKQAENARSIIYSRLSSTFQSNAHRVHFSHVHDQWMRTILAAPNLNGSNCSAIDMEDAYDTLLCVWHELQSCMSKGKSTVT